MIQELIFTSARRGLQLGKSGFCTVASTAGMAENVARLLESLSGYRHLFPPGTPEAAANPVNFSHLISRVGGKDLHIFSRVADAGLDYSGRSNKLAHHIACDSSELPPGGPAAVLRSQPFETRWEREAERLPPRKLAGGSVAPSVCATWERITGDAGWGGALAEAGHKKRPAVVIVGPGAPSLELALEALALLPENVQEQVTFSTFYTNLPANVQCLWRFVLADSPEAAAAKRNLQNLVIDCTAKLGVCPSPAADEARQGRRYAPKVSVAPPVPGKPAAESPLELADGDAYELPPSFSGEESVKSAPPASPYRMAGEPAASAPPELAPPPRGPARFGKGEPARRSSRRENSADDRPNQINTWGIVMLVVGILMTLGGAALFGLTFFRPATNEQLASKDINSDSSREQSLPATEQPATEPAKTGLAETVKVDSEKSESTKVEMATLEGEESEASKAEENKMVVEETGTPIPNNAKVQDESSEAKKAEADDRERQRILNEQKRLEGILAEAALSRFYFWDFETIETEQNQSQKIFGIEKFSRDLCVEIVTGDAGGPLRINPTDQKAIPPEVTTKWNVIDQENSPIGHFLLTGDGNLRTLHFVFQPSLQDISKIPNQVKDVYNSSFKLVMKGNRPEFAAASRVELFKLSPVKVAQRLIKAPLNDEVQLRGFPGDATFVFDLNQIKEGPVGFFSSSEISRSSEVDVVAQIESDTEDKVVVDFLFGHKKGPGEKKLCIKMTFVLSGSKAVLSVSVDTSEKDPVIEKSIDRLFKSKDEDILGRIVGKGISGSSFRSSVDNAVKKIGTRPVAKIVDEFKSEIRKVLRERNDRLKRASSLREVCESYLDLLRLKQDFVSNWPEDTKESKEEKERETLAVSKEAMLLDLILKPSQSEMGIVDQVEKGVFVPVIVRSLQGPEGSERLSLVLFDATQLDIQALPKAVRNWHEQIIQK